MNDVKKALDSLYEKTRLLEDMCSFTEDYVKKQIEEKKTEMSADLRIIEKLSSQYTNPKYIAEDVVFPNMTSFEKTKKGYTLASKVLDEAKISYIISKSNEVPVKTETSESDAVTPINSSYLVEGEPLSSGIREDYEIGFKYAINANYIDIDTVNSNLENIVLLSEDGDKYDIEILNNSYIPTRYIVGMRFTLVCNNYISKESTIAKQQYDLSLDNIKYIKHYNTTQEAEDNLTSSNLDIISTNELKDKNISKITGEDVDSNVYIDENTYKYIPDHQIAQQNINEANYSIKDDNIVSEKRDLYSYIFGINDIHVSNREIIPTASLISNEINVEGISYISIVVDIDKLSGTEFFIIDGTKEVPIFPINNDSASTNVSNIYYPTTDEIKIKYIQTNVDDVPNILKSIIVQKYGKDNKWLISHF